MFETIQIARRHLLRFEYPERAVNPDEDLVISLGGTADGSKRLPSSDGENDDEGDNEDSHLLFGWSLFPYY